MPLNPFRTSSRFICGQTTRNLNGLLPKRDCGLCRIHSPSKSKIKSSEGQKKRNTEINVLSGIVPRYGARLPRERVISGRDFDPHVPLSAQRFFFGGGVCAWCRVFFFPHCIALVDNKCMGFCMTSFYRTTVSTWADNRGWVGGGCEGATYWPIAGAKDRSITQTQGNP